MKNFFKKHQWIPATALGTLLVFLGLGSHSFELDEAFSLYISKNISTMANMLWNEEANMGLYYLLLHFWQMLGTNEFLVRGLSAVFAVLTIPFVYKVGEHLSDKKTGLMASLLLSVNMFFVFDAQFARGYSLVLLLTTISMYSFLKLKDSPKFMPLYVLSTALSFYAHFYAVLVFGFQIATSFLDRSFRKKLGVMLLVGASLLPLVLSPSLRSGQVDWLTKPTLSNLLGTGFVVAGDFPPLFIVYGLLLLTLVPTIFKQLKDINFRFLLAWLVVPIAMAFLMSLIKPIYQSVYFVISLPPFVILIAWALRNLAIQKIANIILVLICLFSIMRLSLWYTKNDQYRWIFSNNSEDWRVTADFVSKNSSAEDAVIFFGYHNRLPYGFYSDKPRMVEIASRQYSFGGGSELPEPNISLIKKFAYPQVWLVMRDSDHGLFNNDDLLITLLATLSDNYSLKGNFKFPETEVMVFEKK